MESEAKYSSAESGDARKDVQVDRFNLETMSGVYPGTRTQIWQRIRLEAIGVAPHSQHPAWALIYWYDEPPAAVITVQAPEQRAPLRIEDLTIDAIQPALDVALEAIGYEPLVCGRCAYWRADAGVTVDGLELGACQLRRNRTRDAPTVSLEEVAEGDLPLVLSGQSTLAIGCIHWQEGSTLVADERSSPADLLPPLPKIAEVSESKMKPLRRWQVRLRRWLAPPAAQPDLAARLFERSGVGAGTEPCPCCQGRIANLGALAVESASGDKETLSVWRCRVCHVLLLSDWIDRWERADSLETEESIYRIAPVEAAEMLELIASVTGGEHPRQRAERSAERDWIHAQVLDRDPLSHMVKQGR